jgi:Zn-dependent M28 family amino/carboxypeptidase
LRKTADTREFKPVFTGITMTMGFSNRVQHLGSDNVIGVVPGSDPTLKNQYVLYSAHWDHLGIGPAVNGDSIYNGAVDNASGVADVLAIARAAAAALEKPKRSQLFLFVTAEESGLLGSEYFGKHSTVPSREIIAALNIDGGNVLGKSRDLDVLGANKSSLGPSLAELVKPDSITLSPEAHPEQGHFYRSDHFSLAKVGIPSVSLGAGTNYIGHPPGWGKQQDEEYTAKHYHQPSDEYHADWDLSGAVQLSDIVLHFGSSLANASKIPVWNADAEFKAIRDQDLGRAR